MKFKDSFGSQLFAGICLIFIFAILIPIGLFVLIFKFITMPFNYYKYRHSQYQKDFPHKFNFLDPFHIDNIPYSIIKENDLLFDTNLVISEDTIFLLTYMTHISLMRMVVTSEYLYRYENSIKSYYHFKIDKLIKQQSAFEKAMAKIESRNIGDLTQLKTLSKSLCFNKYLMSLKDRRAFISGINAYKKYDDNYLSMFGDFKHKIYYYLIFSCPFLGYYIKKHLNK